MSGIAACSASKDPVAQSLQPLLDIMRTQPAPSLNPSFRYLRVEIEGRAAFLALGNIDRLDEQHTEVWYSGDRAVLRLFDGRVASALGFITEWRRVQQPDAPNWRDVARASGPWQWVRVRDVMPGYHIGVRDAISLNRIDPPENSALSGVAPQSLDWFEETVTGNALPRARYAVDLSGESETVVYGEQCLSAKLCFSWQRWTATHPNRDEP